MGAAAPAPPRVARRSGALSPWRAILRGVGALPAPLVAILGLVGLALSGRPQDTPSVGTPPLPEPIRYVSGPPLAERLIVVFLPSLDERGLVAFRAGLGTDAASEGVLLTIARPDFASFDDITLLLLSGSSPGAGDAAPPAGPPDTIVRSIRAQAGRRAALFGPPEWRALLGEAPVEGGPSAAGAPPKAEALLAEAGAVLGAPGASPDLILLNLRDVTVREGAVRGATGEIAGPLSAFGSALGPQDALLIVGGGGAIGAPLHLSFSGAGVARGRPRALAADDLAPTCAVVLGTSYPAATRGRIAWPLLAADERRKAEGTAALTRQRAGLAVRAVPFGAPYPPPLRTIITERLMLIDTLLQDGQFAFAYQLAASSVDEADRALAGLTAAAPLPAPRRAAWPLVIPCVAAALYAVARAAVRRSWGALGAAALGAVAAIVAWLALVTALRRVIVATLPVVIVLALVPAILAGLLSALLGTGRRRPLLPAVADRGEAVEMLVLLATLLAALCAYRYGLPWRLRVEETIPLFRWRSALLAPALAFAAGYGWLLLGALRPASAPVPAGDAERET